MPPTLSTHSIKLNGNDVTTTYGFYVASVKGATMLSPAQSTRTPVIGSKDPIISQPLTEGRQITISGSFYGTSATDVSQKLATMAGIFGLGPGGYSITNLEINGNPPVSFDCVFEGQWDESPIKPERVSFVIQVTFSLLVIKSEPETWVHQIVTGNINSTANQPTGVTVGDAAAFKGSGWTAAKLYDDVSLVIKNLNATALTAITIAGTNQKGMQKISPTFVGTTTDLNIGFWKGSMTPQFESGATDILQYANLSDQFVPECRNIKILMRFSPNFAPGTALGAVATLFSGGAGADGDRIKIYCVANGANNDLVFKWSPTNSVTIATISQAGGMVINQYCLIEANFSNTAITLTLNGTIQAVNSGGGFANPVYQGGAFNIGQNGGVLPCQGLIGEFALLQNHDLAAAVYSTAGTYNESAHTVANVQQRPFVEDYARRIPEFLSIGSDFRTSLSPCMAWGRKSRSITYTGATGTGPTTIPQSAELHLHFNKRRAMWIDLTNAANANAVDVTHKITGEWPLIGKAGGIYILTTPNGLGSMTYRLYGRQVLIS